MKRAIVLAIDGLGTGGIGPYGNGSVSTPAMNRFASQSFLAEHLIIDSPHVQQLYNALLKGGHGAFSEDWFNDRPSLTDHLREATKSSTIIVEESTIRQIPLLDSFDHQIVLDLSDANELAQEPEETWLANFFSETIEALDSIDSVQQSDLIWIHCSGLTKFWDAPYRFRLEFVDEDEPEPPADFLAPSMHLEKDDDPDLILGYQSAHHAQIVLLDLIWDAFYRALDSFDDRLTVLVGTRGYPLGEHQMIGYPASPLLSNLIQVPLMVRYPDKFESARYQGLLQFGDIFSSLSSWLDLPACPKSQGCDFSIARSDLTVTSRAFAVCTDQTSTAFRTDYWFADHVAQHDNVPDRVALFVKPDDRWDCNDVSELCPNIVADVKELVPRIRDNLAAGSTEVADIPEVLLLPNE